MLFSIFMQYFMFISWNMVYYSRTGGYVMKKQVSQELLSFLKQSPSCFHAIEQMKTMLVQAGYEELQEAKAWKLEAGGLYFTTRNTSSILAFQVGTDLEQYSFNIASSHSDSPTFKVKEDAELEVRGKYTQLNTEGYGGMLCATWFDRPLSIAGRVMIKNGTSFETKLVNIDRDLLLIPNVAIHMNREVNDGMKYNKQIDTLPLFSGPLAKPGDFDALIASTVGVDKDAILGKDLYLYNRCEPSIWGAHEEYISAPKLDDLQCAFTSLKGFLKAKQSKSINVFVCFDNEEVGSATKQGAGSTFLYDSLQRINHGLGKDQEAYYQALASSFMLSADNAHALHPNHPEKTDAKNCVYMNEGIVIKYNANQKYTSDAVSTAIFKSYCDACGVAYQSFANRSDVVGGSTLGNVSSTKVSIHTVDIGLAQLAMHSSYETAGMDDTLAMIQVMEEFFNSHVECIADGTLRVSK